KLFPGSNFKRITKSPVESILLILLFAISVRINYSVPSAGADLNSPNFEIYEPCLQREISAIKKTIRKRIELLFLVVYIL
ncbi:hypothetical protein, partial [Salmonella sp. s55044]|uniref:hypothetical protein n=1 Tax=Salmonella sp. s55044 TaxID=3159677 RepID=UPI00397F3150